MSGNPPKQTNAIILLDKLPKDLHDSLAEALKNKNFAEYINKMTPQAFENLKQHATEHADVFEQIFSDVATSRVEGSLDYQEDYSFLEPDRIKETIAERNEAEAKPENMSPIDATANAYKEIYTKYYEKLQDVPHRSPEKYDLIHEAHAEIKAMEKKNGVLRGAENDVTKNLWKEKPTAPDDVHKELGGRETWISPEKIKATNGEKKMPPINTTKEDLTQVSDANRLANPYEKIYAKYYDKVKGLENGSTEKTKLIHEAHTELKGLSSGNMTKNGENIVMKNLWQPDPMSPNDVNAELRHDAAGQLAPAQFGGYSTFQAVADTAKRGWEGCADVLGENFCGAATGNERPAHTSPAPAQNQDFDWSNLEY